MAGGAAASAPAVLPVANHVDSVALGNRTTCLMDDVLEQLRRLRRTMLADVHELESGLRRHSEKQGGEWVDITPQLIKAWRDEAQQLERLIQAYDQRSGFEFPKPIAI